MTNSDSGSGTAYANGQRHNVAITRDRVRLAACFTLPQGAPPLPCVIFAHGTGSSRESLEAAVLGRRLLEAGIATLLVDLSGEGASSADPHQGDEAHVEDLEAAFNWARARAEIEPLQIAAAGIGTGSVIAVRAARRRLIRPAALVLLAPEVEPCGFVGVSSPTLVLAGSLDPVLPQIKAVANWSDSATLRLIAGAGRGLEEAGALEAAAAVAVDWFERHFRAGEETPGYGDVGEGD